LRCKDPPILNPTRRPITFIYTTWDRFEQAKVIADLYSDADLFVDRVFHALGREGVRAERVWEASRASDDRGAQLRIECEDGTVIASTAPEEEQVIRLDVSKRRDAVRFSVKQIMEAIRHYGGPLMINVPLED
jgi:hypothetical protein